MAFGISGAVQHVVGMAKSKLIVAVNTDPEAAIFNVADIGVIADCTVLLPALIREFHHMCTGQRPASGIP
jgi:electron transfer flavoprotein alpha subunit